MRKLVACLLFNLIVCVFITAFSILYPFIHKSSLKESQLYIWGYSTCIFFFQTIAQIMLLRTCFTIADPNFTDFIFYHQIKFLASICLSNNLVLAILKFFSLWLCVIYVFIIFKFQIIEYKTYEDYYFSSILTVLSLVQFNFFLNFIQTRHVTRNFNNGFLNYYAYQIIINLLYLYKICIYLLYSFNCVFTWITFLQFSVALSFYIEWDSILRYPIYMFITVILFLESMIGFFVENIPDGQFYGLYISYLILIVVYAIVNFLLFVKVFREVQRSRSSSTTGLNSEEIQRIKVKVFKKGLLNSNDDKIESESSILCSICACAFTSNDKIFVLDCRHEFHAECLKKWVLKKTTCPYCRRDIKDMMNNS